MTNDPELTNRLANLAEEQHFTVPDLVPTARAARRRRKTMVGAGAALVAMSAVAGGALIVQNQSRQDALPPASPSASAPAVTPTATNDVPVAALSDEVIVSRCQQQMAKYAELPGHGPVKAWTVAHAREYAVGDLVLLADASDPETSALCRIPAEGQESAAVSFSDLIPAVADEKAVLAACSEQFRMHPSREGEPDYNTEDLRWGNLVAVEQAGEAVYAYVETEEHGYSCLLTPADSEVSSSFGYAPTRFTAAQPKGFEPSINSASYGDGGKTGSGSPETYVWATGKLPAEAATIKLIDADVSIPVKDGFYHSLAVVPGLADTNSFTILDASGNVLFEQSAQPAEKTSNEVLLSECNAKVEQNNPETKGVDLTAGTVVATASLGAHSRTLISYEDMQFICDLGPDINGLTWTSAKLDPSLNAADWDKMSGYAVTLEVGTTNQDGETLFAGSGTLPKDAARIEFSGDASGTVEVGDDGNWAGLVEGTKGVEEAKVSYRVFAADGAELGSGTAFPQG